MYGTILKQQIPDIIALEIDLLLVKFCSFFHSIIDMFMNAFCAISWQMLSESWFQRFMFILKLLWMAFRSGDLWCAMLCHSSICFFSQLRLFFN